MALKVLFCWSDISGYMAACWRTLLQSSSLDLFILAFQAQTDTAFSNHLMQGIPCRLLDQKERQDRALIQQIVLNQSPDIIVLCGWLHPPYRQLLRLPQLKNIPFVMGMDTPWWGTWKQRLAPWVLRPFLQRMQRVVVAGERSWQYAYRLGVPRSTIASGLYGIDYQRWAKQGHHRQQAPWPRSFLFVGRYVTTKAIDILMPAYQSYRQQVADPWPLVCCGQGPLAASLQQQPGVIDRGFVQPTDMDDIWRSAGTFILPSRFEPWGAALVEAAASGLPVISTDACGSTLDVVRSWYNGLVVPSDHVPALANAMLTIHNLYDVLPTWGQRSQTLAAPYAVEVWADRWQILLHSLQSSP